MKVGTEQEWQAARKELTASAGLARVGVESWEPSDSQDLALLAEPERRPLPFFEGVHPYHGTSQATGRTRWQRISLVSAVYRASAICH